MSSNKRRKVDAAPGTPLLSAAALRRRLLLEKKASPADNGASSAGTGSSGPGDGSEGKCKAVGASPVKKKKDVVLRTPEMVLLGGTGAAAATEADDASEAVEALDEPPKQRIVQLSSLKPSKSNLHTRADGTVLLTVAGDERLVILGSYGIRVRSGEATICGATLLASPAIHWVHAPHCHALPVLRCAGQSSVEIHCHPAAPDLRSLERLSPIFANLWNEAAGKQQTWQLLATSADGPRKAILQDLKTPAEWNKRIADLVKTPPKRPVAAAAAAAAPVVLVCGPKSSGKSTFARIVANRLVTDQGATKTRTWPGVTVLDIDPGQPDFAPPGVISLVRLTEPNLAPPFCHPLLPEAHVVRSHAVASVTPASDVAHYKACVRDLFDRYKTSCAAHPLIINTPGWVQGSGLVLLMDLITALRPTDVVYMSDDGPDDTIEGLRSVCRDPPTTLPSQPSEYTSRTALHLRHMQVISYFHADGERWDPTPLTSARPWVVRYNNNNGSGILGIVCYGYQPEPALLAEAIDGLVVAVVEVEDRAACGALADMQRTPAEQLPYMRTDAPLSPRHSRCVGLALVRGIDPRRRLIALSSPALAESLNGKDVVLVSGKFDPPTWAYTEDHYSRVYFRKGGRGGGENDLEEDLSVEADEDGMAGSSGEMPWVEKLHGNQKRAVGSKVWRVRRDLGRNNSAVSD